MPASVFQHVRNISLTDRISRSDSLRDRAASASSSVVTNKANCVRSYPGTRPVRSRSVSTVRATFNSFFHLHSPRRIVLFVGLAAMTSMSVCRHVPGLAPHHVPKREAANGSSPVRFARTSHCLVTSSNCCPTYVSRAGAEHLGLGDGRAVAAFDVGGAGAAEPVPEGEKRVLHEPQASTGAFRIFVERSTPFDQPQVG